MPRAQCYYEILGIPETATTEEVKKAYKKLAVIWHPDKNQQNLDEAHAKFQVILKAYETLGDNREREWYDRHKDQILSGGDKNEAADCLDLFQYFSSACYANFDDSEDGFYTVYRGVFDKIAEEERQAIQQAAKFSKSKSKSLRDEADADTFLTFGDSKSSYDDVVRPFYAFWSGFCTSLTFDHLDKYNTTEAENRRILRAMEKENKKLKDVARKERNVNVRNLVEFIKKRDKRLKAHKLLVDQQNELNRKKTAEKQRQQRERLLKNSDEYKPTSYFAMDDVEEQLRQLESEYDNLKRDKRARRRRQQEVELDGDSDQEDATDEAVKVNGDCDENPNVDASCDTTTAQTTTTTTTATTTAAGAGALSGENDQSADESDDDDEEDDEEDSFYCPACNKDFRSVNAFENHEASKKHKQNVQKLTKLLKAEESKLNK